MRVMKHLNVALEAIEFQGDGFHKELTLAIEPFIAVTNVTVQEIEKLENKVTKIIQNRTGSTAIYTAFSGEFGYFPFILFDMIDANSIFAKYSGKDEINAEYFQEQIKKPVRVGTVDLAKSKLTGFFTKVPAIIFVRKSMFSDGRLSAGEIAALILHEIAHLFTFCEMLDRTAGTNQILAQLDRFLKNGTNVKERSVVLKAVGEALHLDERVVEQVNETTNDSVAVKIFTTEAIQNIFHRTDQKSDYYENVSLEYAADEFAARHGAGRDLVTATDKFTTNAFGRTHIQKRTTFQYVRYEAIKALLIIFGAPAFHWFVPCLVLGFAIADRSDLEEPSYDNPIQRLTRIRAQFIEQAKEPNYPPLQAKQLLADVKVIDEVLLQYTDRKDILTYVIDVFSGKSKNRDYQRKLESLAMNDLFLKALEFNTKFK